MEKIKRFAHKVNGKVYYSIDANPVPKTIEEYKSMIKKAYGNLRGVKIWEIVSNEQ